MLVNSKKMLLDAKEQKKVIYQININNLEWTKIILEFFEKKQIPVILGVSEGAIKYMGGYNVVVNIVKSLINDLNITIPVCLHLDHGSSIESCQKACDAGFTSVMIDASKYDYEKNIEITKSVVEYAHVKNITVEAELGHIGGMEDNISNNILLANYNECLKFVNETHIDSLAPAIGTVHGIYKGELNIDYDLIEKLNNNLSIPLVMHGGSGINNEVLKKIILKGISKVNINSDVQYAWYKGVKEFINNNSNIYDPRKIIYSGKNNIEVLLEDKINILN